MSNSFLALTIYALLIFVTAFLSGMLSGLGRLSHIRVQLTMSAVAGLIIGIALLHLLPHSIKSVATDDAVVTVALWVLAGIVAAVALLRMSGYHQHETPEYVEPGDSNAGLKRSSAINVGAGLTLHSAIEGLALGAAPYVHSESTLLPGLGVFLAIALHKPLEAYSVVSLLRSAGFSANQRTLVSLGFALICPAVAVACYFGTAMLGATWGGPVAGYLTGFSAGAFLCLALSDLLPEIHLHSHDRFKLMMAFLVGIGLSYVLRVVESAAY